jgi:superfamily II RNA helicase
VVRLLRRTVDLLAQLPYCPAVSEELRRNGRRALQLINRFPVKEELIGVEPDGINPATQRTAAE